MPLRMYDPEDDREKASVKDKKKKVSMKESINMRKDARRDFVRSNRMLTGGQAKLDKNKNNRIDAQDFKILRREKAKGRGMGLQDEKMKPGKPMKAALGAIALGLGAKKMMDKKKMTATPGVGAAAEIAKKKKEILGKRKGGQMKKDPTKPVNPFAKTGKTPSKRKQFLKRMGRAVKVGARLGVAGAVLGAAGAGAAKLGQTIGRKLYGDPTKNEKNKMSMPMKKKNKKMGGGMMQRPGYNVGGSVTVKTKLGRNKPTKMY